MLLADAALGRQMKQINLLILRKHEAEKAKVRGDMPLGSDGERSQQKGRSRGTCSVWDSERRPPSGNSFKKKKRMAKEDKDRHSGKP